MKFTEDEIDLKFLYAEFLKINDVTGTVSFEEAKILILTERPEIEESLFLYVFELLRAEKTPRINWTALTLTVIECVRIYTYSNMFEKQLVKMQKTKERLSSENVLALIKDLAPKCSREQLLMFVLDRSISPDGALEKTLQNSKFSHEGTSSLQYAEIMCPKEIWRDITKRHNFFGQN
jgi:hypothetical protein